MMQYVKICPDPACGHRNDEFAAICERCGRLLGQVQPTEVTEPVLALDAAGSSMADTSDPPSEPDTTLSEADRDSLAEPGLRPGPIRKTSGYGTDRLTLEFIRGGRVFPIREGQTLGRDDGSTGDPGRVNIPADAGVDVGYVSRWHCRFDCHDGQWSVTPLNPRDSMSELKTANPTYLGAQRLDIGQAYPVQDGDRLTLADVELRIRLH